MGYRSKVEVKGEANNRTGSTRKPCCSKNRTAPADNILFMQRSVGNQAVGRLLRTGVLQAKLKIGQPGDKYEQEADRVADTVMKMEKPQAIPGTLQRACPKCKEEELKRQPVKEEDEDKKLQRKSKDEEDKLQKKPVEELEGLQAKADHGNIPEADPDIESQIQSIKGTGQPLPASERAFFEPRFGADFGDVRVHNDTRAAFVAQSVNARAFTLGHDVVFGQGEYAPGTSKGKLLVAHELTHVLQQKGRNVFQRKIAVETDSIDLSGYFSMNVVPGFTKSKGVYSHPGASGNTLESEILHSMLYSPRTFNVKGSTDLDAMKNLDDHVTARKGIVDFAAKKQYTFASGSSMKMNPAFWEKVGGGWRVKQGVNPTDAYNDLNKNPKEYAIACQAATLITMLGGSGNSSLKIDTGVADSDWVPGDWGYITNTNFSGKPEDVGLEGENLIYVGYQKLWGHLPGTKTYRTLKEWVDEVNGWNNGAKIEGHRKRPATGLL